MAGPLEGLKVIEMEGLGPCPLAGQLLGDLGADVILIDRKSGKKADPTDINNRSKRSVALNLKTKGGVEAALKLIGRADVLIEGFRPGVMEKLGLGPDVCVATNPGLVYGRMTGWGQNGPLANRAGHDINYLSLTGALHAIGPKSSPPVPPLNLAADYAGGTMFLLLGVLSALWERQRSGKGQIVDAAMVDGVPALMGIFHMFLARGLLSPKRGSNMLDGGAPFYRCYETKDGKYLSVGPLEPQFFAELLRGAGLPEEQGADQYDKANWPGRHEQYEIVFAQKTRDEWMAIFGETDSCVAPVLGWDEIASHPHNEARGIFMAPEGILQAAPAPRFSRSSPGNPVPPVAPGQQTEAVLQGVGYSVEDIARLRDEGALP